MDADLAGLLSMVVDTQGARKNLRDKLDARMSKRARPSEPSISDLSDQLSAERASNAALVEKCRRLERDLLDARKTKRARPSEPSINDLAGLLSAERAKCRRLEREARDRSRDLRAASAGEPHFRVETDHAELALAIGRAFVAKLRSVAF
jgi:hypothetical protein